MRALKRNIEGRKLKEKGSVEERILEVKLVVAIVSAVGTCALPGGRSVTNATNPGCEKCKCDDIINTRDGEYKSGRLDKYKRDKGQMQEQQSMQGRRWRVLHCRRKRRLRKGWGKGWMVNFFSRSVIFQYSYITTRY